MRHSNKKGAQEVGVALSHPKLHHPSGVFVVASFLVLKWMVFGGSPLSFELGGVGGVKLFSVPRETGQGRTVLRDPPTLPDQLVHAGWDAWRRSSVSVPAPVGGRDRVGAAPLSFFPVHSRLP